MTEAQAVLQSQATEIARRLQSHVEERDSLTQQLWDLPPDADRDMAVTLAWRLDRERDTIERLEARLIKLVRALNGLGK